MSKKRQKKARESGLTSNAAEPTEQPEIRGLDGLTDAERAQKRYQRRMAERQRSKEKKNQQAKKRQQNQKKRNF